MATLIHCVVTYHTSFRSMRIIFLIQVGIGQHPNVTFLWCERYKKDKNNYKFVVVVAKNTTINSVLRCEH